jgi:hypothetical protein
MNMTPTKIAKSQNCRDVLVINWLNTGNMNLAFNNGSCGPSDVETTSALANRDATDDDRRADNCSLLFVYVFDKRVVAVSYFA